MWFALRVAVLLIALGAIAAIWFVGIKQPQPDVRIATNNQSHASPTPVGRVVTLSPADIPPVASTSSPTQTEHSSPAESPETSTSHNSFVGRLNLVIPVAGVRPDQLIDTFSDARTDGQTHNAIDISAPAGTPVLAVADGEVVRLFQNERGGTTIYQLSADKKLVFYYAHLQAYAKILQERKTIRQGDVIAYVGDTGNAGAGNYHLHFSIAILGDPKRYWEGTNINPYPLLRH